MAVEEGGIFTPDFSEANLFKANLSGANLNRADLTNSNLSWADLTNANLSWARLYFADLSSAVLYKTNFSKANVSGASLYRADLTWADLSLADLTDTNFSGAKLTYANLSGAHLISANLKKANLTNANLSETNLTGVVLNEADLTRANVTGANLLKADLSSVNLSYANLSGANFSKVIMTNNILVNTNLSHVKGLEEIVHYGPSSIGVDTIFKSKGNIPSIFLRGAGVPEHVIDYIPSFIGKPWEYYSCFISYSSKNQDIAERLYADLQKNGVRCWLATEDLKIGEEFRDTIDRAIRLYDKLLLVLSETSVSSEWVKDEVEAAFEKERARKASGKDPDVLFPIRIDDSAMNSDQAWTAAIRRRKHIGDFTEWKDYDKYKKAFNRLLRDLQNGKNPSL